MWRWRGMRNNHGLPTLRSRSARGTEESVIRYLAVEFGVIDADEHGMLFPANGDADDVNPWHRTLRRTERPMGNAARYTFRPKTAP